MMIKGINTGGRFITVNGGTPGSTYINNYSGGQGVGNIRYNTSTQSMEVYDGNSWQMLTMNYATVNLTWDAEQALEWACKKRNEELEWERLASESAAVKIALDNVEKAKQQLKVTATLAKETARDFGEVMEQASP